MTKRNIKQGFEFSLDGKNLYKVTRVLAPKSDRGRFLAIWIGDYKERDMTTYNGHIRHGDFRLDQSLFEIKDGEIKKVHEATGMLQISKASKEYKEEVLS